MSGGVAFARLRDGQWLFVDPRDGRESADASGFRAIVLPCDEAETLILDLPAVDEREARTLVGYKLRALHPGNPEETAFDLSLVPMKGRARALVALLPKETAERLREAARGVPIFLSAQFSRRRISREAFRKQRNREAGGTRGERLELFSIDGDAIEAVRWADRLPVSVMPFRASDGDSCERLRSLCGELPEGAPITVAAGERGRAAVDAILAAGGIDPARISPEEAFSRVPPRSAGLFAPPRAASRRVRTIVRVSLLAVSLMLGARLLSGGLVRKEAELDALRSRVRAAEQTVSRGIAAESDLESLEAELESLGAKRPVDPYRILSAIAAALGDGVEIRSCIVRDRGFELEAEGRNPFALMERFAARQDTFVDVEITRVSPVDETGRERFSLRGEYRDE